MTQAFNLGLLANKVNSSGNLDASTGLVNATPVANGGTNLTTLGASGNMLIATSASAVSAVEIPSFGFKNRFINGAMVIDQRNAGVSFTPTNNSYGLDRWKFGLTQASKFTVQQNAGSVTPPSGFTYYQGITASATAYSVLTGDTFFLDQIIEGYNIGDLNWGTASAKTVTLSFWVRSSLTGQFGGALRNSAANRSYPFSYTISAASTWEQKSITIAGDTSGTWTTTNGTGIEVVWDLGSGSTYLGTSGTWAASNLIGSTGDTSVVGTANATFYITGVQLEKGSTATSFDYRPYGTELDLCQRYFEITGQTANSFLLQGYAASAGAIRCLIFYSTRKRATPTVTVSGGGTTGWSYSNASGLFIAAAGVDTTRAEFNATAAGVTFVYNPDGGVITSSAEL